jgi:hypothetical protein
MSSSLILLQVKYPDPTSAEILKLLPRILKIGKAPMHGGLGKPECFWDYSKSQTLLQVTSCMMQCCNPFHRPALFVLCTVYVLWPVYMRALPFFPVRDTLLWKTCSSHLPPSITQEIWIMKGGQTRHCQCQAKCMNAYIRPAILGKFQIRSVNN